ncbi:hypothetical protein CMU25_15320 [Elizabethkingia anophelis]|nr:hypothetical protein [Elizabethkingia anophelis]MDV3775224.1 hypothetical protein [Elizabethkingia anophelis]MDV3841705.1 hypothetical protein [Elizabethkingia anophelis]
MKIIYYICFVCCFIQLLAWVFGPFIGVGAIYDSIAKDGFYGNELQKVWGLEMKTYSVLNRFIASIYFFLLIFVVISIFFKKTKTIFRLVAISSCLVVIILLLWPISNFLIKI